MAPKLDGGARAGWALMGSIYRPADTLILSCLASSVTFSIGLYWPMCCQSLSLFMVFSTSARPCSICCATPTDVSSASECWLQPAGSHEKVSAYGVSMRF